MTDKTDTTLDGVDEAVALFESEDGDDTQPLAEPKPRKSAQAAETDDEEDGEVDDESGDEPEEEETDKSDVDEEKESSAKLGRRVQKRIDKLTRKAADAEREGGFYKTQLEQERQARLDAERERDWYKQRGGHQPEDEDDQQGQTRGLTPQQVEKIIAERAEEVARQKEFASKVSTLKSKLQTEAPEALARLSNVALTYFEDEAIEALSEASHPVQIAKALNNNTELFNKFSRLPDGAARARLIARLDGSIEARTTAKKPAQQVKPTPKVKGVTRAPEKDPNKMSQAEYEAWSAKQGW